MKLLIVFVCIVAAYGVADEALDVHVKATRSAPMQLFVGAMSPVNVEFEACLRALKVDLEFEDQLRVEYQWSGRVPTKAEIQQLALLEYPIALFLQEGHTKKRSYIDWYLYDTSQTLMIAGKRHEKVGTCGRGWGHELAEAITEALTGNRTCFTARIAYCKDVHISGKRAVRHIYAADMTSMHTDHELVIGHSTLNIAPRWNRDSIRPLLFYSEGTDRNFRLMVNDLQGHSWVASNLDGINMQPAFSADGRQVVFCASRGVGASQLYSCCNGRLMRLTHHVGNSLAPTMNANGSKVYFCSDHEEGVPSIYCYGIGCDTLDRITQGSMAFSPHYCDANECLVYVKSVQGILQIFIYDATTGKHRQVTFDAEQKEECSWSPCGTYICYSAVVQGKGRIVILNVSSGKKRYLTSKEDDCSYPIWSPRYASYPEIRIV